MTERAPLHWKDSAALGATLFLNVYFIETFAIPYQLAASPSRLVVFVLAVGALAAGAFYFAGRGAAEAAEPGWPLDSLLGKLLYGSALLALLLPLSALAASTIASASIHFLAEMTSYRPLSRINGVGLGGTLTLMAWAAWVASRGRRTVGTAAQLWTVAFLALPLGGCVSYWREIAAFVSDPVIRVGWDEVADPLARTAAEVLPLTFVAAVWRRSDREPAGPGAASGAGAAISLMVLLACLCLAGVSVVPTTRATSASSSSRAMRRPRTGRRVGSC